MNRVSIEVHSDDTVALMALGKALMEMAAAPGAAKAAAECVAAPVLGGAVTSPVPIPLNYADGPAAFAPAAPANHLHEMVEGISDATGIPVPELIAPIPPSVDTAAVFNQGFDQPVDTPAVFPAPPVAPVAVELDKNGLPWDMRINTSNRAKTQQGVWKRKPGLTDDEYNAVITELRGAQAAPPAPAAQGDASAVFIQPTTSIGIAPVAAAIGAPPSAPQVRAVAPVPPVAAAQAGPTTFPELLQHITKYKAAGAITIDQVNAVCAKYGIAQVSLLSGRADLIPAVYADLCTIWGAA